MRGDFSRYSHDPAAGLTQLLFRQGQDLIESEFNELTAVLRDQIRTVGELTERFVLRRSPPFTVVEPVVVITDPGTDHKKVTLSVKLGGWAFVPGDGIVRLDEPDPRTGGRKPREYKLPLPQEGGFVVLYLDATEEVIDPEAVAPEAALRLGLGDPALAPRDEALWVRPVVRVVARRFDAKPTSPAAAEDLPILLGPDHRPGRGTLRPVVTADGGLSGDPACEPLAEDRLGGVENQLYRVEVHAVTGTRLQVKWSRDNAAVAYPAEDLRLDRGAATDKLTVSVPGAWADDRWAIRVGDVVELTEAPSRRDPGPAGAPAPSLPLFTVEELEPGSDGLTQLTLSGVTNDAADAIKPKDGSVPKGAWNLLIRWDHQPAAAADQGCVDVDLAGDPATAGRVGLDDLLGVQFAAPAADYRPGDFWLIPVRAATGEALWPRSETDSQQYRKLAPHGPRHTYLPLAVVDATGQQATFERYPWGATDELPTAAGEVLAPVAAGAHTAGADVSVKLTTDKKTAVDVADALKDVRLPVRHVFNAPQLLVVALGKTDPLAERTFTPRELADAARRLSFDPKTLTTQIVTGVNGQLTNPQTAVKDRLKTSTAAPEPKDALTLLKMLRPDELRFGTPAARTAVQAKYTMVSDLAADTFGHVLEKVDANNIPPDDLKAVWQAARRVKFFLDAWPFAAVRDTDWA